MNLSLIREYLEQDKPINMSTLKEYCRYLQRQLDEQNNAIRYEFENALARTDYSLAHVLECFLDHHKEESK